MNKKVINQVDVTGKRVLLRVDYNVPLNPLDNSIMDDSRIRATFPTIKYLVENGAKTIICSHLGRPKGKIVESLRMAPVARRLSELIALPVFYINECVGEAVQKRVNELKNGDILVLENLRFYPEEEANDLEFAKKLALLADLYVDDAFGNAHRSHASNVGITKFLPAYCGLLMYKEITSLGKLMTSPEHPFAVILGGAKVSDKMGVLKNIINKVDVLLLGGSMATNIMNVKGIKTGKSRVEPDINNIVENLIDICNKYNVNILLPVDVLISTSIQESDSFKIVSVSEVPDEWYIVDIGPKTIELYENKLKQCRTIFWNGPMGIYEIPEFAIGTKSIVNILSNIESTTIIGGGSTAEIVEDMKATDFMSHVSTGGGASLEFLEGKSLPAVEVLLDN